MRFCLIIFILMILLVTACAENESSSPAATDGDTTLILREVVASLDQPVFVTYAPNDSTSLYIVEQTGTILKFDISTQTKNDYLEVSSKIRYGGEMGLLGLAFHPDFQSNRYLYINYTQERDNQQYSRVERYTVAGDFTSVLVNSDSLIMEISQPYSNHNAGMLAFGPDGYLYIGWGDGGSGGDPQNYSQNPQSMLGKMLRIDVDNSFPYGIPSDNPFIGSADTLPEIWAFGLRNPWRYAFDRETGDLWIADVGQNEIEEIDFQPATSSGGENYGWRLKEGTVCYNPGSNCDDGTLTDPVHEYTHSGTKFRCSITGGYVYRGGAIPGLDGAYFFADYCSNQIWSLKQDAGGAVVTEHSEMTTTAISSFGEDYFGELYVVSLGLGKVYKIVTGN